MEGPQQPASRHLRAERIRPRTERPSLSRERVVEAALSLLDQAGLDGLSMRRLAERLGIKAASLYWYVRDKEELLELIADAICSEARAPTTDAPWRWQLEAFEAEYRRVLLTHRDAAHVFARTVPAGPNRLLLADRALGALLIAGFRGLEASRAGRLLADYVESFVQEEERVAQLVSALAASGDASEALEALGRRFVEAPADRYPSIAALAPYLPDENADERFRFGLTILLDGFERHLAKPTIEASG